MRKSFLMWRRSGRRGATLIEVMFVVLLSLPIAATIASATMFVSRSQATAANMSLVRSDAEAAMRQLAQDIRYTSRDVYNDTFPEIRLINGKSGTTMQLQLFDLVNGKIIYWTYNRNTLELRRQLGSIVDDGYARGPAVVVSRNICDLMVEEVEKEDSDPLNSAGGTVKVVTGLQITARALLSLKPRHTMITERDGNNDGDLRNDWVGQSLFGRPNRGDDPVWQYIVNRPVSFRNS